MSPVSAGMGVISFMEVTTIYSDYNHKHMYLLIEIRHNVLIQFHGNYVEVKKISIICLKLTFSEITHNKILGVLIGDF